MSRKCSAEGASGPESPARRRGPKPLLSVEQETQLAQWVLVQQSSGRRVSRDDVISQAQEMSRLEETQEEETKPSQSVGMGWCNRFIARHPGLNLRPGAAPVVKTQGSDSTDATVNFTVGGEMPPNAAVGGQEADSSKVSESSEQSESKEEDGEAEEAAGPTKTRKYNRKHMEAAVEMYLAGKSMSEVTQRFPLLHQRTIRRRVLRVQRGEVDRRRGPRPLLEGEPEQELVAWILDMQSRGTRVTKKDILARANEQYQALTGETAEDRLKEGWLRRFKERHPVLSGRAPTKVHQKGDSSNSSTESEKGFSSGGDGELSSSAQSTGGQQRTVYGEEEEKQKRSGADSSGIGGSAALSKRQKTEDPLSTRSSRGLDAAGHSASASGVSVLPERRQVEKAENVQSNNRLEEMQRQQLEMLQQLCASNDVLSRIAGAKRVVKNSTRE